VLNVQIQAGSEKYVSVASFEGNEILKVDPEALAILASEAMRDIALLLRTEHNESVGRTGDGGGVEERSREFPGAHPGGRQGKRLLQAVRLVVRRPR
jgi:hypothetical protein